MSEHANPDQWRRCSSCKKPILFEADYYICNVSTCNRGSKGFVFCSVSCWDAHLGIVRHRESWAEDAKAPTRAAFNRAQTAEAAKSTSKRSASKSAAPVRATRRIIPPSPDSRRLVADAHDDLPKDILVVVSKLKKYVKAKSGIHCSDRVAGPLSDALRRLCDEAIERAIADERKTLLERDFESNR